MLVKWVRFWWVDLPARVARLSRGLALALTDGVQLTGTPWLGIASSAFSLVLGFVCARLVGGDGETAFTGSLIVMSLLLIDGSFGAGFGIRAILGYALGDVTSGHHAVLMAGPWWPFALLASYGLLAMLIVNVPWSARLISRVSLPRIPLLQQIVAALLAGGLTYLWTQAAALLIRPLFTWPGSVPPLDQIAPVQKEGIAVALVAVGAVFVTGIVRDRLAKLPPARALCQDAVRGVMNARPLPGSWLIVAIVGAAALTLLVSGMLLSLMDWLLAFVGLALIFIGSGFLNRTAYARVMGRVPFGIRYVIAMVAAFVIAWAIVIPQFSTTDTFQPLILTLLAAYALFALLMPVARRAVPVATVIAIAFVLLPAMGYADNCAGLGDCFSAGEWAALAAAAVVVVAGGLLIAGALAAGAAEVAAAGALEAAGGELAAGEAAAAAESAAAEGAAAEAAAADAAAAEAAAAEDVTAEAVGESGDLGLPNFNPEGFNANCGQVAENLDQFLGGGEFEAAGENSVASDVMAGDAGANWSGVTNAGDIGSYLEGAGDGSRGIVMVSDAAGNGHVFNVINSGGDIIAIDGQSGIYGSISNVSNAAGYGSNPAGMWFLPTFP